MKAARFSLLLLMLSALGLALPAQSQPGPGGGRFLRERPAGAQRQVPPRRDDAEGQGKPDERAGNEDSRRQMTPEQRRQLRRDIGDAGRELYRPQRPSPDRRRLLRDKPRPPREN